ncbi:MAG: polysaccharide biosynthesis C-terminal domain-containing protein [Acidobacteriota bacterium]|nr:polysaccharide biosynthesis C-terminal domain-containing protein [Acidobacteriota bacterium]
MSGPLLPAGRMARDTAWNFAALAATAGVGGLITILIAVRMGPAALGVFAQLYAAHVIGAQAAVFGIHDSTQRHTAGEAGEAGDSGIVVSALLLVLLTATVLAVVLVLAAPLIGAAMASADVVWGLYLVAPGVVCFALNKVLFGAINGRGQLRLYAWMQLLRAALVLAAAVAIVMSAAPVYAVGAILTVAELLLLPCLLLAVRPGTQVSASVRAWGGRHLAFGSRGLVNGVLLETHLRVDVIALGYFVSDRSVGIYAFAMLFAEAVYQVPVVIRTVAYPTIVQLAARMDRAGLAHTARRLSLVGGGTCAAAAAAVAIGYPLVAPMFDPQYLAGVTALQLLLIGMTAYAFVIPFDQLLLQSGFPGRQSLLMALYVGINVVLNILLIPAYGLAGAAASTAISLVSAGLLLLAASWVWLGYRGTVLLYKAPAA